MGLYMIRRFCAAFIPQFILNNPNEFGVFKVGHYFTKSSTYLKKCNYHVMAI